MGHNTLTAVVRLSVCPVSDLQPNTEGRSKVKIGRREARRGDPHSEIERSNSCRGTLWQPHTGRTACYLLYWILVDVHQMLSQRYP